jgi:hypothetical protein
MDPLEQKLKVLGEHRHCQNCGMINPSQLDYAESPEGLTQCCNEAVCNSLKEYMFGNEEAKVQACCWAVVETKLRIQGIDVLKLQGITRFRLDKDLDY